MFSRTLNDLFRSQPTVKVRDSQRSKVYKAEDSLKELRLEFPKLYERFESMGSIQGYVDRITNSKWWGKYEAPDMGETNDTPLRNPKKVTVKDGRGLRRATAYRLHCEIQMPCWARYRLLILHELTHILQSQRPGHGRQFCRIFMDLVRRFAGKKESEALKQAFKNGKVKWTKKRKGGNVKGNPGALKKWREQQVAAKVAAAVEPEPKIHLPTTVRECFNRDFPEEQNSLLPIMREAFFSMYEKGWIAREKRKEL